MRNPETMAAVAAIMEEYFGEPYPIHSFWIAHELAHPEYLIEMEVTAVKE
jgi:enamine deaminase RidA (YjgF/YER057c/UK114 family)